MDRNARLSRTNTTPVQPSRWARNTLTRAQSSPEDDLHRVLSAQFMDDDGAHHYTRPNSTRFSSTSTLEEEKSDPDIEVVDKVTDGIKEEYDVEKQLTRSKSSRPSKDPNLVSQSCPNLSHADHVGNMGW